MYRTNDPKRSPVPFTAPDGVACLRVPLADNRGEAIIEADDMHAVAACGVGSLWSLDSNGNCRYYVRGKRSPGNRAVSIARAIAGASPRQHVHYHDGNPFNLRRGNLYLVEGKAKMDCAALVAESTEGDAKSLPQIFEKVSDGKANDLHPPVGGRFRNAASIEAAPQVGA